MSCVDTGKEHLACSEDSNVLSRVWLCLTEQVSLSHPGTARSVPFVKHKPGNSFSEADTTVWVETHLCKDSFSAKGQDAVLRS